MKKIITLLLIILVAFGATSFAAHVAIASNNEIAEIEAELAILETATPEVIIDGDNLNFIMGLNREEAEAYGLYDGEIVYINHQNAFSFTAILHFEDDLLDYNSLLSLESDIRVEKSSIYTAFSTAVGVIMITSMAILGAMESIESDKKAEAAKAEAAKAAKAAKAAREAKAAKEKAEAEAIIAEAAETLANIKDNGLVVFGKFFLEFSLERCCNYVSRDNINNLREALDNLVYRC